MIKRFFAGGNTVKGFYSYFDNILPIEDAKRIFVIKGGPGTGKSTTMKEVAADMEKAGHIVELCHCSSDNNSLDGVFIKDISVLMLDGTAPHVVDLKLPGIVDEIINLGDFWNEEELKENRNIIMDYKNQTSDLFYNAYSYLSATNEINKRTEAIYAKYFGEADVKDIADSILKDIKFETKNKPGKERKLFLSAITSDGIISYADTISEMSDKTIVLADNTNISTGKVIGRITKHLIENGINVETFYSPFAPDKQIEHLYVEDLGLFITSKNRFLDYNSKSDSVINIDISSMSEEDRKVLEFNFEMTEILVKKSIESISKSREIHNEIEKYYIKSMDFNKLNDVTLSIINKIKNI